MQQFRDLSRISLGFGELGDVEMAGRFAWGLPEDSARLVRAARSGLWGPERGEALVELALDAAGDGLHRVTRAHLGLQVASHEGSEQVAGQAQQQRPEHPRRRDPRLDPPVAHPRELRVHTEDPFHVPQQTSENRSPALPPGQPLCFLSAWSVSQDPSDSSSRSARASR